MPEQPGDDALLLSDSLAISQSVGIAEGEEITLYSPQFGRASSNPQQAGDALIVGDGVAQAGPQSTANITIRDSQGESTGTITLTQRDMTIEDYCGYRSAGDASVSGPISDEMLEVGVTSFLVYENTNTGDRSFGWFHDKHGSGLGQGGEVDMDISGLPESSSMVVRDDDTGNDSYTMNPPDAFADHQWSDPNTDGLAIGKFTADELQGVSVTFDVQRYTDRNGYGPPSKIRFIGDEGTTVERSYDGTNTQIEIQF